MESLPVAATHHYSTPDHPNGWDVYVDEPFDHAAWEEGERARTGTGPTLA